MRVIQVLLCCGLVGCSAVETAVFSDSSKLYEGMTDSDVALAAEAMQLALETKPPDEPVGWINDETGHQGSIVPRQTFITDRGVFCRAYDETLAIGDRDGTVRNSACRSDDGKWTWTG